MTTSERRRLRALAEQFPAAREALLSLAGPRRTVKAAKKERLATAEKTREGRNIRMGQIRAEVRERHGGLCVLCGHFRHETGECHHLISGNGRRRVYERTDTCVWVCGPRSLKECHELAATDPAALSLIGDYCIRSGMVEAARAVARRREKIIEARAPHAAGAQP